MLHYGDMTIAPTPCNSTTAILLISFCVTMYTYTSLLRQILDYYIEFANNLAINFNNWCYIGRDIAVGALYQTIVATQKNNTSVLRKFPWTQSVQGKNKVHRCTHSGV